MASLKKVREYMTAAGLEELNEQVVAQVVRQMKAHINIEGMDDEELAAEIKMIKNYESMMKRANEIARKETEKILAESFSDKEFDELIAFCLSPVAVRMRKLQPEIMQRAMDVT